MCRALTTQEVADYISDGARYGTLDEQTDNHGQLVIYTNLWRWNDNSIRSEPDPEYLDDA